MAVQRRRRAHRVNPVIPAIPPIPIPLPPRIQTVLDFLDHFAHKKLPELMTTFSTVNNPASYPRVGITSYGPQFIGNTAVQRLFRQLFNSFDPIALTPQGPSDPQNPGSNWLFNNPALPIPEIGIQMNFSGVQIGSWFAAGTPYYSPPLSDIVPDSTRTMDLDACVIFYFDSNNDKISQTAIYFDRYLMSQQLMVASRPHG